MGRVDAGRIFSFLLTITGWLTAVVGSDIQLGFHVVLGGWILNSAVS